MLVLDSFSFLMGVQTLTARITNTSVGPYLGPGSVPSIFPRRLHHSLAVSPPGAGQGSRARVCGPAHRLGSSLHYTCSLLSGARVVTGARVIYAHKIETVRQGEVMWPATDEPGLQNIQIQNFKALFLPKETISPWIRTTGQAAGLWPLPHSSSLLSKHRISSHSHSSPRSPCVQGRMDGHWHFKLMVVKMELNS